jgi:hypothetical protein
MGSRGDSSAFIVRRFLLPAKILLSPMIPLDTRHSGVSLMFPLHTQKQGGVPLEKCRRADISSLFSPHPHARLSFFSIICALFHFP